MDTPEMIKELQSDKKALENQIINLLRDFTTKYFCVLEDINVDVNVISEDTKCGRVSFGHYVHIKTSV